MKHFLITRFNLKVKHWKTAKDGSIVLTKSWLDDRFHLFENYCLPSVRNQVNQNFSWVVFFDIGTPSAYRQKIEQLSNNYDNLFPIYIDGIKPLRSSLKQFIKGHLDKDDDFIITSRMDNDDVIHRDFIDTIQRMAKKDNGLVLDLRKGIQMNISNNFYEVRNHYTYFNAFVSLVENSFDFNTVMHRMHQDWKDAKSIVVDDSKALWIELIHNKNKLNSVNLKKPLVRNIKLHEFGIVELINKRRISYILVHNLKLIIKRIIRR